jgi:hypothetical protein
MKFTKQSISSNQSSNQRQNNNTNNSNNNNNNSTRMQGTDSLPRIRLSS